MTIQVGDKVRFTKQFAVYKSSLYAKGTGTVKEIKTFGPITLALVDGLGLKTGIATKYLELVKD